MQIRDPRNAARITATVLLDNAALATSTVGGLGAGPDDPSRIHNADRLALPALAGATVQAPTCVLADALTKIVLATGDATHPLLAEYGQRSPASFARLIRCLTHHVCFSAFCPPRARARSA